MIPYFGYDGLHVHYNVCKTCKLIVFSADRRPKHPPETHARLGNQKRADGVFRPQEDQAVTNSKRWDFWLNLAPLAYTFHYPKIGPIYSFK